MVSKNWFSHFFALLVPVLALTINLVMASSLLVTINVGFLENVPDINEFMENDLMVSKEISFLPFYYENLEEALEELAAKEISLLVSLENEKDLVLYYDSTRQDSQIAAQYIVNSFQTSISKDLLANHPEEVYELQAKQKYVIQAFRDLGQESPKGQKGDNIMLLLSFMWILLYLPLNFSISQITSEKNSRTMYYFFKLKSSKILIILAKQVAVIIQCIFSSLILILILIIKLTAIYSLDFQLIHLALAIFLIIAMSSVGYFFGLIISNGINITLISLFVAIPNMIFTALNTSSSLDKFLKIISTYYLGHVIRAVLFEDKVRSDYLLIILAFTIFFYALSALIFSKREPDKLCKYY